MKNQYSVGLSAFAAVATALVLSACHQRDSDMTVHQSSGSSPSAMSSEASQKIAAETSKVETAVDDTTITTKVKAALLDDPGLKSLPISVDTKNAVVTLTGSVDSPTTRDRAKQVASTVSGVSAVVNQLNVQS